MLYYYTVYALSDCGYCARAISQLGKLELDHVLVLMDKAPDFRESIKTKYEHNTVPVIVKSSKVNGDDIEFIGGFQELMLSLDADGFGEEEC